MKTKVLNTISILALALAAGSANAQTVPNTFNYQAVITAEDGTPVSNHDITVEVSILQGNNCDADPSSCTYLWQELHTPKTNDFGSFSIEIGDNNAINTTGGTLSKYSDIQWLDTQQGSYYMQVRVDFGKASYLNGMTDLGTTKFSAVPYALAAKTAESAKTADAVEPKNGKIGNKLPELADVTITNPRANQILVYDGTAWKNTDPAAAQGLTNINISEPATGDLLVYNANNGKWQNQTPQALTLKSITDVQLGTIKNNDILKYNSTTKKWENETLSLNFINGVNVKNAQKGQVLTFTENGIWEAAAAANGGSDINKLSQLTGDVSINTEALKTGQILQYNETSKKWEAANPAATDVWMTDANGKVYNNTKYGNIGIGTQNPADILHISGGASQNTLFNGNGINIGVGKDNRVSASGGIAFGGGKEVQGTAVIAGSDSHTEGSATNSIIMGTSSYGKANCDIAIGDYNKASYAHSALFGSSLETGISFQYIFGRGNSVCRMNSEDLNKTIMFIVAYDSNVFTIDREGNVNAKSFNESSDERLKTNVNTISSSLDNILKLRGVTFNWKKSASNDHLHYGFIAQEVEKVFPDLVGTDSNGFKTVNYSGVIPVLTEAIKTQQEEIESLKSENEQLKSTLEQLLKRVEALENK